MLIYKSSSSLHRWKKYCRKLKKNLALELSYCSFLCINIHDEKRELSLISIEILCSTLNWKYTYHYFLIPEQRKSKIVSNHKSFQKKKKKKSIKLFKSPFPKPLKNKADKERSKTSFLLPLMPIIKLDKHHQTPKSIRLPTNSKTSSKI